MKLPHNFFNNIQKITTKGVGVDILQKSRIYKICTNNNKTSRFAAKILSQNELDIFNNLQNQTTRINYLAKRFCAKEAISKALGTGIGSQISFKDISVLNNSNGRPIVNINKQAMQRLNLLNENILISISDEALYCIAFCVINSH